MTTATKKDAAVIHTESMILRIGSLYQDRERFLNYPPFQRDKVWGRRMKQIFIDSLLRKLPINALTLMEDTNARGERIYQIIDGQQRVSTVFDYFENKFPTMSEREARGRLLTMEPLYPSCKFKDLPLEIQNRFLDYKLPFTTFPREEEDVLEEVFMRFQNQEPLSVGERLFIHNGRARHVALALLEHPFWQTYKGATGRRETFQSALNMIAMEVFSVPVHLKVSNEERAPLVRLILGEHDDELSETFQNGIWKRLSEASHAFKGAHPSSNVDLIILYQACILLGQHNYTLLTSPEGVLTDWFHQAKRSLRNDGFEHSITNSRLTYIKSQQAFWQAQLGLIQQVPGLVRNTT